MDYLKDVFNWLIGLLKELALSLLLPVLREIGDTIPNDWNAGIQGFMQWLAYVDSWIPLAFGIKLLLAYYGIKLVLLVIKYVLKAIPGIWG